MPPHNWSEEEAKMALIAQALGHPMRIQILRALGEEGAFVSDLVEALNRPQPHVSGHLAVLRESGLVVTERKGTYIRYRLAPRVSEMLKVLAEIAAMAAPSPPNGKRRWRGGWKRRR